MDEKRAPLRVEDVGDRNDLDTVDEGVRVVASGGRGEGEVYAAGGDVEGEFTYYVGEI